MSSVLPSLMSFLDGRFELIALDFTGCPVYVYVAVPIGATSGSSTDSDRAKFADKTWLPLAVRPGQGRFACGRGISQEQAILSCLGEAAELVSTCYWGNEHLVAAKLCELGSSAVHPNEVMLISNNQYRDRERWNVVHGRYDWIPPPCDEERALDWVEASSPDGGEGAFVPAAYAYIGFSDALEEDNFCVGDSNGCASAPSEDEATVTGFLELVERDATAIWWYGRHCRPLVELDSSDGMDPAALLDWHRSHGRVHYLLDITTDLAIPVFAAVSANQDGSAVALGFGAHFVAERAALAALTEMLQLEISFEMYRRGGGAGSSEAIGTWLSQVNLLSQPQLLPSAESPRRISEFPHGTSTDPVHLLQQSCAVCDQHGLTLLKIDLTRREIGVPVVRTIVPGLRHFHARFAPGRLYQVPVKLGWCSKPLSEASLNPTPLMI